MFYYFELTTFPRIQRNYTVTRNTVWEITETEHMLIFILEGCCQFTIGNESNIVHKGDIIYIPANQAYLRRPVDNTFSTMSYVHFFMSDAVYKEPPYVLEQQLAEQKKHLDSAILSGDMTSISSQAFFIYLQSFISASDNENVANYLSILNSLSSKIYLTSQLQSSANLCNLLAILSQMTIDDFLSNTKTHNFTEIPPNLKRAISYIAMHYSEPITLSDLANHCNISKQQLIRYFNNAFDTTPTKYITDFKLSRAKELLFYHPDISIKEIAAELGFENQHYFSRVFTNKNGETPSQYRNRTLNYQEPDLESHKNK